MKQMKKRFLVMVTGLILVLTISLIGTGKVHAAEQYYLNNGTIENGKTINGDLAFEDEIDQYEIVTSGNNSFYVIEASAITGKDYLEFKLCNDKNEDVQKMNVYINNTNKFIVKLEKNSTYKLFVSPSWWDRAKGTYKFSVTEVIDDCSDNFQESNSIVINKQKECNLEAKQDEDYYKFTTTNNNSFYKFELINSTYDGDLAISLYDENFTSLNWEVGARLSIKQYKFIKLIPNKTYYIKLHSTWTESTGKAKLIVSEVKDDVKDVPESAIKLSINKTSKTYTLQAQEDTDYFSFKTGKANKYNITLKNTSKVNTWITLSLYDSDNIYIDSVSCYKSEARTHTFTLDKNKKYYVKISDGADNSKYKIKISKSK